MSLSADVLRMPDRRSDPPVTFFLDSNIGPERLGALEPGSDRRMFQRGEHVWILQTFQRLAAAGYRVRLTTTAPSRGTVVFHAKHARALRREWQRVGDAVLVAVRADNREVGLADFEVVQNGRFADGRRRFFIPSWPQPGLIPRDPARGTALGRASFKGFASNLHPDLRTARWRAFLADLGIDWECDTIPFSGSLTDSLPTSWHDYSAVDVVVAVRPGLRDLHTRKPAAKLVNAWLAGVPAVLGPEFGYRELRRTPLDYLEVANVAEAEAAVARLARDPDLYRSMVDNGRRRAAAYNVDAIARRWATFLFETLPARLADPDADVVRRLPVPLKWPLRHAARLLALRPAR